MKWFYSAVLLLGLFVASTACAERSGDGSSGETMTSGWDPQFTRDWGPKVGEKLPELHVSRANGSDETLTDLAGEKGLLLFFVRSTNW